MLTEPKADAGLTDHSGRCAVSRMALPRRFLYCAALFAAVTVSLPAWALHWPWTPHPATTPQPVRALSVTVAPGTAAAVGTARIAQYWDRNTLLLDLTRLTGEGSATLTPIAANGWPVRLEFRVRPGAMAQLEVVGAQRVVFPVPAQGSTVLLKLDPGVYQADTARISVRWSATADLPH